MLARLCDVKDCASRARIINIPLGREIDGAGSIEDIVESLDLCERHISELFDSILKDADLNTRKRAANYYSKRKV